MISLGVVWLDCREETASRVLSRVQAMRQRGRDQGRWEREAGGENDDSTVSRLENPIKGRLLTALSMT